MSSCGRARARILGDVIKLVVSSMKTRFKGRPNADVRKNLRRSFKVAYRRRIVYLRPSTIPIHRTHDGVQSLSRDKKRDAKKPDLSFSLFARLLFTRATARRPSRSLRDDRRRRRRRLRRSWCLRALAARSRNSDVVVYQPELTASYTSGDITRIINSLPRTTRAKQTRR